jgi:glutamate synthase domain-containing protein 2/glutamate synthase domain-containing protein 1/glutamate synthase domain-containing protein 3
LLPPTAPEIDACGIGFVADAHGRSSRALVTAALGGLACVKHRGAVAADARTADGSGLLLPVPPAIFGQRTGVAVLFVRGDDPRAAVEAAAQAEGLTVTDWRVPPTDGSALGDLARETAPRILHALFQTAGNSGAADDERRALRLRRRIERTTTGTYVASCSFSTIVYKGLAPADAVADYYLDLADDRFEASFAIFHQRFSTNTLSTWERAQPFRNLCHNGEINALWGNERRMRGRATLGTEAAGLGDEDLFRPVVDETDSDSGKLDAAVELLTRAGRDIRHVMAMVMPQAWENAADMDPELHGFYSYHSALMEPWDGPAGVIFTDGVGVGARLDRNGLRPLRYQVCDDGFVAVCSEVGAVDVSGHGQVQRGRLGPGQMLFVDPTRGFLDDHTCQERVAAAAPYAKWAGDGFYQLPIGEPTLEVPDDLANRQVMHGFTKEELSMVLRPMAGDAYEPTFSMGDDSPLPNLAPRARAIAHYLRQRFAQVTNPPIDPLRERLVMSLRTVLGPRAPLLSESPDAARMLTLKSFFVYPEGVDNLQLTDRAPWPVIPLDATFPVDEGPAGVRAAIDRLRDEAVTAVAGGAGTLVIEDGDAGPDRAPVPSLLAVGAVHQALTDQRVRSLTSLVVVADDVFDVHGFAALLGYGADAICPRLALATVASEADENEDGEATSPEAQVNYQAAVEAGVLKILSKMGICTVDSYRAAQIFEVVGLSSEVVDVCFTGTPNVVGGIGWADLGDDVLSRHRAAWGERVVLESPGFYRVRKGGEPHAKDKDTVQALNDLTLVQEQPADGQTREMLTAHLLQSAIRSESSERYDVFAKMANQRPLLELHDLLELVPGTPVPLDEVEPASEIVRRFSTGAMSHGALSKEAHETLAQAMNLLGGMSNCGEGGEDPYRYRTRGRGRDDKNSKIKQIASGRFGVTPEYLAHADELQIKMAQGSKPGEGGQLPGHKVSAEIARLRHTQPGVGLISPPPHHDIYSIEDLAQLIYDLKQVNAAQVSVKLVAEEGVGTIAAGCVKALADVVHISGQNGGTGASPLSSIKHAGMPWELGLADAQRALVDNGLRSRVRLRVDGGFLTGRQVIMAALLGADEYSFGTAAMIAEGCIMLRACHRDTCKPGVATQRAHLRANFTGTPEGVASYFLFIAEEVRQYLAQLGLRTIDEAIGRVDLLRQRHTGADRADAMNLAPLLEPPVAEGPRRFVERVELQDPRAELGDQLLADAFRPVWDGDDVELSYEIVNSDRAIGAALSGAIALEYGELPPRGTARVRLVGTAGQSFAAFLTHGVELELTGEANDYVGKGMGGGLVVVRRPANDGSDLPVLAGNTCLYGATGGELFVAGGVGERFGVRNSGAVAVVESAGDHCCEYMTGGIVVVTGPVGGNLGAGMTGGEAFVFDDRFERLMSRLNRDLVDAVRPDSGALDTVRWLIERHAELTGSERSARIVDGWAEAAEHVWHILPKDQVRRIEESKAGRVVSV